MATKEEAMEHMRRGGVVSRKSSGIGRVDFRRTASGLLEMRDTCNDWFGTGFVNLTDDEYELLPIEAKPAGDLMTPEERRRVEGSRRDLPVWVVSLFDRLAPKPDQPLPKWVEELAGNLDELERRESSRPSYSGIAATIRERARKAMEDGNG